MARPGRSKLKERFPIMHAILRLVHKLEQRPADLEHLPARLRTYAGEQDIEHWLAIRNAAFAFLGGRAWTAADFRREFLAQPWWPTATLWLAEVDGAGPLPGAGPEETGPAQTRSAAACVGTVLLAPPALHAPHSASLRWLAVDPAWQRRHIAKLLTTRAEQAAWDAGWRKITVETHARWHAAVAFYRACGYSPQVPE